MGYHKPSRESGVKGGKEREEVAVGEEEAVPSSTIESKVEEATDSRPHISNVYYSGWCNGDLLQQLSQ